MCNVSHDVLCIPHRHIIPISTPAKCVVDHNKPKAPQALHALCGGSMVQHCAARRRRCTAWISYLKMHSAVVTCTSSVAVANYAEFTPRSSCMLYYVGFLRWHINPPELSLWAHFNRQANEWTGMHYNSAILLLCISIPFYSIVGYSDSTAIASIPHNAAIVFHGTGAMVRLWNDCRRCTRPTLHSAHKEAFVTPTTNAIRKPPRAEETQHTQQERAM